MGSIDVEIVGFPVWPGIVHFGEMWLRLGWDQVGTNVLARIGSRDQRR